MTSNEIIEILENEIMPRCAQRFLTTGAKQYSLDNGIQQFENMSIDELHAEFEDEVLDAINYLSMILIRARQIKNG